MEIIKITESSTPEVFKHSPIIMGIVSNENELDSLSNELLQTGVPILEILEGVSGVNFLEQQKKTFEGLMDFLLGDMETQTRKLYSTELKLGNIAFAVPITKENRQAVVDAVQRCDAKHVVSFGTFVNENIGAI